MVMIRHRANSARKVPTKLLYSSRSYKGVIYREELDRLAANDSTLQIIHTLTRRQPENWRATNAESTARCLRKPLGSRRKSRSLSSAVRPHWSSRSPLFCRSQATRPNALKPSVSDRAGVKKVMDDSDLRLDGNAADCSAKFFRSR